jgi:hypothetical protein
MYTKALKIFCYILCFFIFILFCLALIQYPGKRYIYILFTLILNVLLLFGFRKERIFFDTFIGLFFWLGYWLKFSFRMAFMGGKFFEPVGSNFDYSGASYDHALLVTACGVAALVMVSFIRGRFFFSYPEENRGICLDGLFTFYKKYRKAAWFAFFMVFVTVAVTNAYFGIYQRGTIPRTQLPYKFGGVYTWLLLFGTASISALLLEFELVLNKKITYSVVTLGLLESFFSSVSMLSRGMVLNVAALAIGAMKSLKMHYITPTFRFYLIVSCMFIFLFGISTVAVMQLRIYQYADSTQRPKINFSGTSRNAKILILDRWVGIEGTIAVSSYPELGWDLWKQAWKEKYSNLGTSFYDLEIASSVYTKMDFSKHHFISLPGILAFFYYPGSFAFLFISMFLAGTLAAVIEVLIFKLSGSNVILTSLLAQVVASRYAHFGYVPGQSYLLFGTLGMNVILIFLLNRFLLFHYKKRDFEKHPILS